MEFELEQIICNTLHTYVLVYPFPIIRLAHIVLIVCALFPARRPRRVTMWRLGLMVYLGFTGRFLAR